MRTLTRVLCALGVGRDAETHSPRPIDRHLFRSVKLKPWSPNRMRFGWIVSWDGPWWHNAIGLAGPEWNDGDWLGGMSWHRYGPFVVCRSLRRQPRRRDRRFLRAMECTCPPQGLLWPIGHECPPGCPACRGGSQ